MKERHEAKHALDALHSMAKEVASGESYTLTISRGKDAECKDGLLVCLRTPDGALAKTRPVSDYDVLDAVRDLFNRMGRTSRFIVVEDGPEYIGQWPEESQV